MLCLLNQHMNLNSCAMHGWQMLAKRLSLQENKNAFLKSKQTTPNETAIDSLASRLQTCKHVHTHICILSLSLLFLYEELLILLCQMLQNVHMLKVFKGNYNYTRPKNITVPITRKQIFSYSSNLEQQKPYIHSYKYTEISTIICKYMLLCIKGITVTCFSKFEVAGMLFLKDTKWSYLIYTLYWGHSSCTVKQLSCHCIIANADQNWF
jgi:hypothetical protein